MGEGKILAWVIVFVAIILLVNAEPEKIYVVNLNYDKGDITLIDVFVKQGYAPGREIQPEGGYRCEVISFKGEELDSFKFMPPTGWAYDYIDPETGELKGGVKELEEVEFSLIVPYFSNGKRLDIYNPEGVKILEINISGFAEVQEEFDILPMVILALIITAGIIAWRYNLIKRGGKFKETPNERVMALIKRRLKEGEDPEVLKKGLQEEGYDPGLVDKIRDRY